jgi:outer membrane protein OmpU
MRKVLLATTALVGVALSGVAHAAPASPISLNVGGYVDFVAGLFHESNTSQTLGFAGAAGAGQPANGVKRNNHDFETEFKLSFDALGKASNGIEYGANVSLWNGSDVTNNNNFRSTSLANTGNALPASTAFGGGSNQVTIDSAYVWLSGAFGKALFGDEHGASDLFVYAPTVGEGQIDGRYMDFTDPLTLARFQPSGIDNTEHSTKVTYYTPKVGNDMHKVQVGVSYIPNMYDYGQNVIKYNTTGFGGGNAQNYSPYQDVVKLAAEYWGNFHPVNVVASGQVIVGGAGHGQAGSGTPSGNSGTAIMWDAPTATDGGKAQAFTAWGLGTQAMYNGFTFGGSYVNLGRYNTVHAQNEVQDVWTLGGKYEFDKVAIAANWLNARGYDNQLATPTGGGGTSAATTAGTIDQANYVHSYNAYGLGATYTWFPGLTSNIDGVLFQQSIKEPTVAHISNDGYVFLVSQKLTF